MPSASCPSRSTMPPAGGRRPARPALSSASAAACGSGSVGRSRTPRPRAGWRPRRSTARFTRPWRCTMWPIRFLSVGSATRSSAATAFGAGWRTRWRCRPSCRGSRAIATAPVELDGEELGAADLVALAAAMMVEPRAGDLERGADVPRPQHRAFRLGRGPGAWRLPRWRHPAPRAGRLRPPSRPRSHQD